MEIRETKQKPVKIWFSDMYYGFDVENNYILIHLRRHFNIEINEQPDFLIHSVYSNNYLKYNCFRICVTWENTRPDFKKSDFHIGFDYINDDRYLRWPNFLMGRYMPDYLLKDKDVDALFLHKKRFCSFVVSNAEAKERVNFFAKLSNHKKVASGGRHLNNIGGPVENKWDFLRESKFNIAFENVSYPGYTTEKIFDAFLANTIPIYWGSPRVAGDFNEKAFLNVHEFSSTEEVIERIKFLDENDDAYKAMLSEPAFPGNRIPEKFDVKIFIDFFEKIFNADKKPVAHFFNNVEYWTLKGRTKFAGVRKRFRL